MRKPDLKLFVALFVLCWCSLSTPVATPQESDRPESNKATLFYDSRRHDTPRWDLSEEPGVFRYVEQVRAERPRDRVVYVGYGPLGEVAWYLKNIEDWLKGVIKVDPALVFTFDGGREDEFRYQVWLVPEGAEMPKVESPPAEDEKAILKFTGYSYPGMCEYCSGQGSHVLEALAEALKQRPRRKAYLEFYGCGYSVRHRSSGARLEALKAKRVLTRDGGVAPSRILVKIREKSRRRCGARIWLLPAHLNSLPLQRQKG